MPAESFGACALLLARLIYDECAQHTHIPHIILENCDRFYYHYFGRIFINNAYVGVSELTILA